MTAAFLEIGLNEAQLDAALQRIVSGDNTEPSVQRDSDCPHCRAAHPQSMADVSERQLHRPPLNEPQLEVGELPTRRDSPGHQFPLTSRGTGSGCAGLILET